MAVRHMNITHCCYIEPPWRGNHNNIAFDADEAYDEHELWYLHTQRMTDWIADWNEYEAQPAIIFYGPRVPRPPMLPPCHCESALDPVVYLDE